jgi:threonylcarbamoyladenosine tRNA methylthiotransferase MtaB
MQSSFPVEQLGRTFAVAIETHGCKLNSADSQVIASQFIKLGCVVVDDVREADIYVLNTCTVTHQADLKAKKALRAAARANPDVLLSATGCYVERQPGELLKLHTNAGPPIVLGNSDKDSFAANVLSSLSSTPIDLTGHPQLSVGSGALNRTRATLKIQEGCDQICSYCIVPKVRGREISIPYGELLDKIEQLNADGVPEVVLTGTQLGTYGHEFPDYDLMTLLGDICANSEMQRIRISSLQPHEITHDLLQLWNLGVLCPHFHIPLQSGADRILQAMRRRYTSEKFIQSVELVRELVPNASITTDVIVGFPGESARDFDDTYEICKQAGITKIHVFPYSLRPGTSAAYFPDHVDSQSIKTRAHRLRLLSAELEKQAREGLVGTYRRVLWESAETKRGERVWSGLTEDYFRVTTIDSSDLRGLVTPVEVIDTHKVVIR